MPSIADRYARPREPQSSVHELNQGAMQQVQEAGKTLAAMGVKQNPMAQDQKPYALPTPAQRFGRQATPPPQRGRSLS